MEAHWQKFTAITNALGLIAIPIVIAFASYLFSQAIESKKSEEKFITIAVDILKTIPEKTLDNEVLREWAIEVIDRYSDVELTKPVKIALQDSQLPEPSFNQEKVKPICYFVEVFLTREMKPMISKDSFEEIRAKNNVRTISESESGKMISSVNGDIYGYVSPYDLNENDFIISAKPTLRQFQEIHRVNGELFLVGRGLVEKWDDIVHVQFGVATQMNLTIEMPFGLMARIKGQVHLLRLKDAYSLSVQEIRGVIQRQDAFFLKTHNKANAADAKSHVAD